MVNGYIICVLLALLIVAVCVLGYKVFFAAPAVTVAPPPPSPQEVAAFALANELLAQRAAVVATTDAKKQQLADVLKLTDEHEKIVQLAALAKGL